MIVAGTGHRSDKLGGYNISRPSARNILSTLAGLTRSFLEEHAPTEVIGGCALGFDQLLMHTAIKLGIPVCAAVPFEGFDARWPDRSRAGLAWLLKRCARVVVVEKPGYAAWKLQARNVWMVDNATDLLTCWDGSEGGTQNCIGYAHGKLHYSNIHHLWTPELTLMRAQGGYCGP